MRRGSVKQGGDQARVRDWLMSHPGWHLSNAVGRGIDLDPSRVGTILSNMRRQSMTESRSVYLGGRRICEYRLTPEYEALVRGGGADAAPTEAEASAESAAPAASAQPPQIVGGRYDPGPMRPLKPATPPPAAERRGILDAPSLLEIQSRAAVEARATQGKTEASAPAPEPAPAALRAPAGFVAAAALGRPSPRAEPAAVPVPVAADPIPAPEGDPIPEPTSAPDLEIAAAAPPMRCALWSDGMLDLVFADRGERVTLGREHAAVLIAYIRGLPTPAGEGACA